MYENNRSALTYQNLKIELSSDGSSYTKSMTTMKDADIAVAVNTVYPVTFRADASVLLLGKFTVASGKQVQFTRGNLYYSTTDGKYHVEDQQNVTYTTLGQSSYTESHVCHFFWSNITDWQTSGREPWAGSYNYSAQSTSDKFFCGIDNPMEVDGQSGLYALTGGSSGEWNYLINSRDHALSLCKKGVSVTTSAGTVENCLVIAPDDWDYTNNPLQSSYDATAWATAESDGLVCLPAAGYRSGSNLYYGGSDGRYWSATPSESHVDDAYRLYFNGSDVIGNRGSGYSVRLVYSEAPAAPVYPEAPALACVKICDTWWAPVNCGYDATNAPTGLFYQWGRKYGQSNTKEMTDADFITTQAESMAAGNTEANKDKFYKGNGCWFSGNTTSDTWSSECNPCPAGWRVPTETELTSLNSSSNWVEGKDITGKGSGSYSGRLFPASGDSQIFFPVAGYRHYSNGSINNATTFGYYWSSWPRAGDADIARSLYFDSGYADMSNFSRAYGYSVRCVQE